MAWEAFSSRLNSPGGESRQETLLAFWEEVFVKTLLCPRGAAVYTVGTSNNLRSKLLEPFYVTGCGRSGHARRSPVRSRTWCARFAAGGNIQVIRKGIQGWIQDGAISCTRALSSATESRSPSTSIFSLAQPSASRACSCEAPYCIFAQYPRGGLMTPNRLQRFPIAISLTSKDAATVVTGSVHTASSNSSESISNFRCQGTRHFTEQVARLITCDAQILMGVPHTAQ